ncbi:hypothetical protein, partial [Paraclostridium bifermentans]|uniref:hypothetical protein n=1 Tax=Paraclostridium bifermentans TaxID=1490 RepID=UPI001C809965
MKDTIKGILWGIFILSIIIFYPKQGGSTDKYFDKKEEEEQEYAEYMEKEGIANQEAIDMEASLAKSLYYIDNGYYYHDDINCKGLESYTEDEINKFYPDDLIYHQELKPCNWCNNNSTDYTNSDTNHKNDAIEDSIRESAKDEIEKRQEERRIREGESMTTKAISDTHLPANDT